MDGTTLRKWRLPGTGNNCYFPTLRSSASTNAETTGKGWETKTCGPGF